MRRVPMLVVPALLLVALGSSALAQRGDRPQRERGGPPRHPLLMLLDQNEDGEISAEEIARAARVLKRLDKNGDGKLTADELPGRPGGPPPGLGGGEPPFGPPDRADFLARMREADANRDGKLSKDEAPERLLAMFDRMDANQDGVLDREEMARLADRFRERLGPPGRGPGGPDGDSRGPGRGPGGPRDFVERMWNLDSDEDGKISKDEAPERMRDMFDRADSNGDGYLDEAELKTMAERFEGRGRGRGRGEPRPEGAESRPKRPDSL